MLRSKLYWPKLLLSNWYGLALLLVVLWGTITQLLRRDTTHLRGLALVWLVAAGIVSWAFYRATRSTAEDYRRLEETLPDSVMIALDGVHFEGPTGARAFSPWTHFERWREGRQVIVLDRSVGNGFTMLPVGHLSATELDILRRLLRRCLSNGMN